MGIISITDCRGLPCNMFLSIWNKQNNLVPILQDGGDKQCHLSPNCYQFFPKKSSQKEASYHWVFQQIKRHPPSSLLYNQEIWVRYITQAAAGHRKTCSSRLTRDLTILSADQKLTNDWQLTDQYCAISHQFFWLEFHFLVIFHC